MKNYVIVTGASSGVGRETAIQLSSEYNLILNGRDEERLSQTKEMCNANSNVIIWAKDLSNVDELESTFSSWIKDNSLIITSLVHCAGALCMIPIRSVSLTDFNKIYALHVFAPAIMIKVLNSRKHNQNALRSVVFISSNISERGARAFSVYGSSKAALDGLMRNLAVELAPRVRVNSILPGGMATRMTEELMRDPSFNTKAENNYPLGMGTPANIASVVKFLLSDSASWITGQAITVDGGRTIDITDGNR